MLKGWFPLHNKHWRNNHKCGEIEMEIQWRYVPGYDNNWEPPKMGAMSKIKMNSAETNLRMGDLVKVKEEACSGIGFCINGVLITYFTHVNILCDSLITY